MRLEFCFTCPFCLLHEADLISTGAEGTGLTAIEHFVAQSRDPQRAVDYSNCYLACRYCNTAKGANPLVDSAGRRLLDPCKSAWTEHFVWKDHELSPLTPSGEWTRDAYDLNDPRKTRLRRRRQRYIQMRLHELSRIPKDLKTLGEIAASASPSDQMRLLNVMSRLSARLAAVKDELAEYQITPVDAPVRCKCSRGPPASTRLYMTVTADYESELTQQLDEGMPREREASGTANPFFEMGRDSAEVALKGPQRALLRAKDPQYLLSFSETIHAYYYGEGRQTYERTGAKSATLSTYGATPSNRVDCFTTAGWYKRAIELSGGVAVTVTETQCRTRGDQVCEYKCAWS